MNIPNVRSIHLFPALLSLIPALWSGAHAYASTLDGLEGVWRSEEAGETLILCVQRDPAVGQAYFAALYQTPDIVLELFDLTEDHGASAFDAVWLSRDEPSSSLFLRPRGNDRVVAELDEIDLGLTRVVMEADEEVPGPCGSMAFHQARTRPGSIERSVVRGGDTKGDVLRLQDAGGTGHVEIALIPGEDPGATAINEWLRDQLPGQLQDAPYFHCSRLALGAGRTSYWYQSFRPEMTRGRWAVVEERNDYYCGGAYPDVTTIWHVFDRETGALVDTSGWIRPDAFLRPGEEIDTILEDEDKDRVQRLWNLMNTAYMRTNPPAACDYLMHEVRSWSVRPVDAGLALVPETAHASRVCAIDIILGWGEVCEGGILDAGALICDHDHQDVGDALGKNVARNLK